MSVEDDGWTEADGFAQRESERAQIRATLEPIAAQLLEAAQSLDGLSMFTIADHYSVARARLAVLAALRSVARASHTTSEDNRRALGEVCSFRHREPHDLG